MALRLTALGRAAQLSGGSSDLFNGSGNNLNIVFRAGAAPADVDTAGAATIIATLAAANEGASNVNGTYGDPTDDGNVASAAIRSNITGNAASTYDYADGGDGAGHAEFYVGTGRTAGDKFGDVTVGGPGTTGTQDFNWTADDITSGGLLTVTAATLQQISA